MMPVHKSIQTAGHNYLFNWVALTVRAEVITLTRLNVRNMEKKNNKHSFNDSVGNNVRDRVIYHLQLKNRKDLKTNLLPVLEVMNVQNKHKTHWH